MRFQRLRYLSRLGLIVCFCPLVMFGCHKSAVTASDIRLACTTSPSPPTVGPATICIALSDNAGRPIRGADVQVEGDMAHPGMVPVFGKATELTGGQYQAPLQFTMAGDWALLIDITLPDRRHSERQVDVRGVQGKHIP